MDKKELRKEFDKHVEYIKSANTYSLAEKRINAAFEWLCDIIEQNKICQQQHKKEHR
jgi:hypothetical protein